ncbi:type IV pilus assembly protein PilM [Oligoflexaceae bacterium]|nr:type IV pilus assembly protein PilM [Oligoflexaceae bacterium]
MMLNKSLIGIDIGASSVKIVEVAGGKQKKLKALGLELIPPSAIVDGRVQDFEVVGQVIRELLQRLNIMPVGRRAAISLYGTSIQVKRILVSADSDTELEEQILYAADQKFDKPIEESYFRYQVQSTEPDENGQISVLAVTADTEIVNSYLELFQKIGLKIGVVDCDVLCLANMLEFNYAINESIVGIFNIGATSCQLVLVGGGQFLYTSDVFIAGDEYSRQITELFGVNFENAETIKVSASAGHDFVPQEMQAIVDGLNEQVVNEMYSAISFFTETADVSIAHLAPLSHVFLCGGGAKLVGLDAAIAARFQVPVQVINPFQRVDIPPKIFDVDYVVTQGHLYSVAMGLALRKFGDHEA